MILSKILRRNLLLLLILLPGVFCVTSVTAAFKYLHEGMVVPEIAGNDLLTNEKISSLAYINDNNLTVVVFWATWSKRSIQELEDLAVLYEQMKDQPVKFIAINVEGENQPSFVKDRVLAKTKELNLPFPVIYDNSYDIFYSFGVIAVPSTAIIDSTGIIRFSPAGYSLTTRDYIEDSIKVLLGLKQPEVEQFVKKGYQPNNKSSRYYYLAVNLTRQGMYEQALQNINLSIEADTNFPSPYSLQGEIYFLTHRYDESVTSYQKALEKDSTIVVANAGLGSAYLKLNQLDSAMIYFQKALTLDDSFTPAFLDMGLTLAFMGKTAEALDSLKAAQELNARNPIPYYYMGQVYLEMKDSSSATNSFKTALELLFPDN